jgi:hypothetical protein
LVHGLRFRLRLAGIEIEADVNVAVFPLVRSSRW